MESINAIINSYNIPVLSAFLLGIMTSISPCPLATNITAIAYISKDIKTAKHTLISGLLYTLGRGISYTLLALLIYFGMSAFSVSNLFQGWGDKVLGPVLILISLLMFGIIRLNISKRSDKLDKLKQWLSGKGYLGSLLLGVMFALAFCPYSGVLFFGMLMPLILNTGEGLLLPPIFALGTGIPVILFSFLLTISLARVSQAFRVVQKIERIMRYIVASVFMLSGAYYTYYLIIFLIS